MIRVRFHPDPAPAGGPPPEPAPAPKPAPLPPSTADLERRILALEKRWEDNEGLSKKERDEIRSEIGRLSKLLEKPAAPAPAPASDKRKSWEGLED